MADDLISKLGAIAAGSEAMLDFKFSDLLFEAIGEIERLKNDNAKFFKIMVDELRIDAYGKGHMHANWDLIIDAECLLRGQKTIVQGRCKIEEIIPLFNIVLQIM